MTRLRYYCRTLKYRETTPILLLDSEIHNETTQIALNITAVSVVIKKYANCNKDIAV